MSKLFELYDLKMLNPKNFMNNFNRTYCQQGYVDTISNANSILP